MNIEIDEITLPASWPRLLPIKINLYARNGGHMTKEITIEYQPITYDNLYDKYPNQCNPQPAYFEIDCSGDAVEVSFGINAEIGSSVPSRVWHGRAMRYEVPSCLNRKGQEEIYSDSTVIRLIEAIAAGCDCRWDGSNHRGYLNEAAQSASDELDRILQDRDWSCDEIWEAGEWLGDMDADDWSQEFGGDYSEAKIDDIEANIQSNAGADGITLVGNVWKIVSDKATELRDLEQSN